MRMVDKWILSHPGGPAGPFWGIVTQSGRVVALQIVEREDAEMLLVIGNVLAGDDYTVRKIANHTDEMAIREVVLSIWKTAMDNMEAGNKGDKHEYER